MRESRMRPHRRHVVLAACLAVTGTVAAQSGGQGGNDAEFGIVEGHRRIQLPNTTAHVNAYERDGRIRRLYGQAFSHGATPQESAESFLRDNAEIFNVPRADLVPMSLRGDGDLLQGIKYDPATGSFEFIGLYFEQVRDGVPVFRSRMTLLMRNEAGFPLVLANPDVRGIGNFRVAPGQVELVIDDAAEAAILARFEELSSAGAEAPRIVESSRVIWAGVDDMVAAPRLANVSIVRNEVDDWLIVTDAATGGILHEEHRICFVDLPGNVSGLTTEGAGSEQCESEVTRPLPWLEVTAGTASAFTDANGDYLITNLLGNPVTVDATLSGLWFDVLNFAGAEDSQSVNTTPPSPANFLFNPLNLDPIIRAQVNTYRHANVVRDFAVAFNPSYPTLMNGGFPATANRTDGFCPGNAWYDPGEVSINFCQAGGTYPNTSWTSVIYHEYGHHLVQAGGSGQGQYGEGMGDVMSTVILDSNLLGLGFFGDCVSSLRNADNTIQYPCSGGIHDCGQLISGCVWDTRNELIITEPSNYLNILGNLVVNSILVHSGTTIAPDITIDYLTLDDDNANIFDGTPHYNEIAAGFGAHNMDAPALALLGFEFPGGLPDLVSPAGTTTLDVVVTAISATPEPGSGVMFFDDGTGAVPIAMTETSPGNYEVTLPSVDCATPISYYFTADTTTGSTQFWPVGAPGTRFEAVAATSVEIALSDDFESDTGWTVSGAVDDGPWQRGVPAGGGDRGDPPTDADGSSQCYVTDNADGNSDVDNGTTILTSPIIDASNPDAFVSYYRWYSNTFGADPMNDTFVVEVSDNGGSTWSTLEIVGPAGPEVDGGWFRREFRVADFVASTNQFRIRFLASDLASGSVIEAGVDGVEIRVFVCDEACSGDVDGNLEVDFQDLLALLASWGPCGGCPADFDGNGEVDFQDLLAMLAAWGPCP